MHVKKIILLFLTFNLSTLVWGLETFTHPHCSVYINKNNLEKDDQTLLAQTLKEKGYLLKKLDGSEKMLVDSFYVDITKTLTGKLYKECLVELSIKKASSKTMNSNDEIFYQKSSLRKFPRHTFQGDERCTMALTDLFFEINICKTRK